MRMDTGFMRAVMSQVVVGRGNKQIAVACGGGAQTVKVHRFRAMHTMQAASLAALLRMADALDRTHIP